MKQHFGGYTWKIWHSIQSKCQNRIVHESQVLWFMVHLVECCRTVNMDGSIDLNSSIDTSNPSSAMNRFIITEFNRLQENIGHTYSNWSSKNCLLFTIFYFSEKEKFIQFRNTSTTAESAKRWLTAENSWLFINQIQRYKNHNTN